MAATPATRRLKADDRPPAQDLDRLFALRHGDPHTILGPHPVRRGTVVRAYRPDAEEIRLIPQGGKPLRMTRREGTDLFEVLVKGRRRVFSYRFDLLLRDGSRIAEHRPRIASCPRWARWTSICWASRPWSGPTRSWARN